MRKSVLDASFRHDQWQPKYPFDLVVAYQDAETRNRAVHLQDHLAQRLDDDFDFQCIWWSFEHITDPTLREQAIDDAMAANMIVLSLHGGNELPAGTQAWLDEWSHRRDHNKCALVTLFAETTGPTVTIPFLQRLKNFARKAHMDFFTNLSDATGVIGDLNWKEIADRVGASGPTTAKVAVEQRLPLPRWGINEA